MNEKKRETFYMKSNSIFMLRHQNEIGTIKKLKTYGVRGNNKSIVLCNKFVNSQVQGCINVGGKAERTKEDSIKSKFVLELLLLTCLRRATVGLRMMIVMMVRAACRCFEGKAKEVGN